MECHTKVAVDYPEIECTNGKARKQMNFEVNLTKVHQIRQYFFVLRMYPMQFISCTKFLCSMVMLKISL